MERLTEWDEYGNADIIALSDVMPEIYAELSFSETNDLTDVLNRLAAYEDTGLEPEEIKAILERYHAFRSAISDETGQPMVSWTRAGEICRAEKDGRLVVLNPVAKEGVEKPPCFYNDMGQPFCLGFARGEYDDEPIDRCKECWYCESTREEAEAALKKREATE